MANPQLLGLDRRVSCQQGLDVLQFIPLQNSKVLNWDTIQVAPEVWPICHGIERVQEIVN